MSTNTNPTHVGFLVVVPEEYATEVSRYIVNGISWLDACYVPKEVAVKGKGGKALDRAFKAVIVSLQKDI